MSHRRDSYLGTPEAKRYKHALEVQRQEIGRLEAMLKWCDKMEPGIKRRAEIAVDAADAVKQ